MHTESIHQDRRMPWLHGALHCLLVTCLAMIPVWTWALDVQGTKVDDSATVAGTTLPLQGAGMRYKAVFKVYAGALYANEKIRSLDALLRNPGPKRLSMTFVRDIDANSFGKLLTRGVEDNTPKSELSKLVPGLLRMSEMFSANKSLSPGDVVTVDWIPGTGMVISVKGKPQGEPFKDADFYRAIMGIWLGPVPADHKLKDALLGAS
ncbi:chalcone isomerase family protein [Curvibacter sp. CHRR-16]|uniref:chalcone isomerase family protein n=1 Tax=Curvibacter sp. CHRR-16 TaxID=2835872 RepID=UPI001BD96119|nr:chalcone isomerase family protein [Curvibacter sp. CHRR-16]MBT0570594.1 chalcone isomerase family protein [Curvibacter sp. CHRR-16]